MCGSMCIDTHRTPCCCAPAHDEYTDADTIWSLTRSCACTIAHLRTPHPHPHPQTDNGKVVAIFHILTSVSLLGSLISEIFSLQSKRADILKRAAMLTRRLDPDLITSLDTDGGGVDKTEFVVGMLVKLELVDQKDVEPYLKQFANLDVDGSGVLTSKDLEAAALAMEAKVAGMKIPFRKNLEPMARGEASAAARIKSAAAKNGSGIAERTGAKVRPM